MRVKKQSPFSFISMILFFSVPLCLCDHLWAQGPAMTAVRDTVYKSDGSLASGTVVITWRPFVTADSKPVFGGTKTVPLSNGALAVALVPNQGGTPSGTSYNVKYYQSGSVFSEETWVVPSSSALPSPNAPTVSNIGTPGSTTYYYWVSAKNANGETLLGPSAVTTTSNSTLNETNYNQISWSAVTGATSYRVWRTATATAPSGTGNYLVGETAATSINDQSNSLQQATAPSINDTDPRVLADVRVTAAPSSTVTLAASQVTGTAVVSNPSSTQTINAPPKAGVIPLQIKGQLQDNSNILEIFDSQSSPVLQSYFNPQGAFVSHKAITTDYTINGQGDHILQAGAADSSFTATARSYLNSANGSNSAFAFKFLNPPATHGIGVAGIVESNATTPDRMEGVVGIGVSNHGSGTRSSSFGLAADAFNLAAGTTTNLAGLHTYAENKAGTSTNTVGVWVDSNVKSGGTVDANYGLKVESQQGVGTHNWDTFAGPNKSSYTYFGNDNEFVDATINSFGTINPPDPKVTVLGGYLEDSSTKTLNPGGVAGNVISLNTSGTRDLAEGIEGGAIHKGSGGTVSKLIGIGAWAGAEAGTVTDLSSIRIYSNYKTAGTVNNNYGLKIENQGIEGANNWAIQTGFGKVQFGDEVVADKSLAAKTISKIRFADQFAGANYTAKVQAAADDFAGAYGLVVSSSDMGAGGAPNPLPEGISLLDLRNTNSGAVFLLHRLATGNPNGLNVTIQNSPDGINGTAIFGDARLAGVGTNIIGVTGFNASVNSAAVFGHNEGSGGTGGPGVQGDSANLPGSAGVLGTTAVYGATTANPSIAVKGIAGGSVSITAATNANPVVLTVLAAPPNGAIVDISGATGSWTPINGTFTTTYVNATQFSIPVDSTTFGALTGSVIAEGAYGTNLSAYFQASNAPPLLVNLSAGGNSGVAPQVADFQCALITRCNLTLRNTSAGGKRWDLVTTGASDPFTTQAGWFYILNQPDNRPVIAVDPATPSFAFYTDATGINFRAATSFAGKFTHSNTDNRTWTLPNANTTVAGLSVAQTWAATQTFDSAVINKLVPVTFSATPTFDASLGNSFKITLTGNVTSSTLANVQAGQQISWIICQDATGGRTFVWPANVKGGMTISGTANTCNAQTFLYDGTNAYALSSGVTGM